MKYYRRPRPLQVWWRILMASDREGGHWFFVLLAGLTLFGLSLLLWFATP